tara:strand:- start:3440 stop:4315 length:876 start_codon:yes stop_codon:yes gene_type:complete
MASQIIIQKQETEPFNEENLKILSVGLIHIANIYNKYNEDIDDIPRGYGDFLIDYFDFINSYVVIVKYNDRVILRIDEKYKNDYTYNLHDINQLYQDMRYFAIHFGKFMITTTKRFIKEKEDHTNFNINNNKTQQEIYEEYISKGPVPPHGMEKKYDAFSGAGDIDPYTGKKFVIPKYNYQKMKNPDIFKIDTEQNESKTSSPDESKISSPKSPESPKIKLTHAISYCKIKHFLDTEGKELIEKAEEVESLLEGEKDVRVEIGEYEGETIYVNFNKEGETRILYKNILLKF